MVKYAINHDKKQIIAYLENTRYDAVRAIDRRLSSIQSNFDYYNPKLLMAEKYSGTVTLRDGDVWDEEKGKELAKAKCLRNYYAGFDKRIKMFYNSLIKTVDGMEKFKH